MMNQLPKILENDINQLIQIMLTDGIQPNDLTDNIFLHPYKKISYIKAGDFVIGELVYEEEIDGIKADTILRYYYNSLKQVIKMISEKKVIATSGKEINIEVDTLCIHGDGAKAVEFAQNVSSILKGNNIEIKTI